jgi:hypothetical protein
VEHFVIGRTARVAPEKRLHRPPAVAFISGGQGEDMAEKLSYWEQLRSPQWQRRRLEIMQRDEFRCQYCRDDTSTLNVHHKHYIKGRLAWEYSDDELVTLCEPCHELSHEENEQWKPLLAKLPLDGPFSKPQAFALIAGWSQLNFPHDLQHEYGGSKLSFTIGEIAAALDLIDFDVLLETRDALINAGPGVISSALLAMAKALRDA